MRDLKQKYDCDQMKNASTQRGVWRQAGRCLVGHFAGFWKFTSRPCLCETPPDAKPQTRYMPFWDSALGKRDLQ